MSNMKFPTGPTAGIRVSGTHSRGQYFCGVAALVGTPPKDALLFMSYPVTTYAPADLHTKIDTKKLGEELGVPVGVNADLSSGFDNSANYTCRNWQHRLKVGGYS